MKDKGRFAEIPSNDYPPIQQACVILKSSQVKPSSRDFLQFLRRGSTKDLLRSYGFATPADDSKGK